MALTRRILYSNNAKSTLAAGISAVDTGFSCQPGDGLLFPNPSGAECFLVTFRDAFGNYEIMVIAARSTDTFTVLTRGVDGTTARSWVAGAKIELRPTALIMDQLVSQLGQNVFAVGAGTADAITAVFNPTFAALIDGMEVRVRAPGANTGAVTFAPDGLLAKPVVKFNNTALVADDIVGASHELLLRYSATLDKWVLLNPNPFVEGRIKFPAIQVPSADVNTLDDYEEGTWTPSVGGTATYNTQSGYYVKIGKLVYVSCLLTIATIGTGSTSIITGLPFASGAEGDQPLSVGDFSALVPSLVFITPLVTSSDSTIFFRTLTAAATSMTAGAAIFQNGSSISLSGCYRASA